MRRIVVRTAALVGLILIVCGAFAADAPVSFDGQLRHAQSLFNLKIFPEALAVVPRRGYTLLFESFTLYPSARSAAEFFGLRWQSEAATPLFRRCESAVALALCRRGP